MNNFVVVFSWTEDLTRPFLVYSSVTSLRILSSRGSYHGPGGRSRSGVLHNLSV